MKRAPALLLLALLGACDDDPSGPAPVVFDPDIGFDILINRIPVDEEVLRVGDQLELSADFWTGKAPPAGNHPVDWRSLDPTVASVGTTGLVTARAPGTTQIVAATDVAVDTLAVTVVAIRPLPSDVACGPDVPSPDLEIGQIYSTRALLDPIICLQGGAGAEYTFIPFHAAASVATLAVEVAATGVAPVTGPPTPALLPRGVAPSLSRAAASAPRPDRAFDARLRRWEARSFAALRASRAARPGPAASTSRSALARRVPAVGDTLHLNVNSNEPCTDPDLRVGRVEAVTEHAIVVADTANPSGGFDRDEYRAFGVTFDTLVWRVDTRNFGEPEDFDANEKILIFFTRAVNELSPESSGSVVGGFFYGRDLFERSGTDGCPGSNAGELFYMLVPDPNGTVNRNERTKDYVAGSTVSVLAHEFQHLINFSRRLFVNDATSNEEVWLNEGLSHVAEELVFYEASNLAPELNIDVAMLRSDRSIFEKFIEYQWSNFGRLIEYLEDPANASPLANDDELSTRGATWAFLRYAADRASSAGEEQQIWFDLVNSRTSGVANLAEVFGTNPIDWLQDWTVAVYTDDTPLLVSPRFQQESWNFRSILGPAGLRLASTGEPLFPVFPLDVVPLGSMADREASFALKGGGAAFVRFAVAPGERAAVRTSSGGAVAPGRLRVMIVRTK